MRIGIIGAGEVGGTLARLWSEAGHELLLSARRPERLAPLVAELGARARAGTVVEAAAFGVDAVLLAVNYWTLDEALEAAGSELDGKVVIDATNPLAWADGIVGGRLVRLIPDETTAGEAIARRLPDTRIAKAFTTPNAKAIAAHSRNGRTVSVAGPFAADDKISRQVATALIRDAGLTPMDLGSLAQSRPLDPGSAHWGQPVPPDLYLTPSGSVA